MKKAVSIAGLLFTCLLMASAGLKPGDKATGFSLINVDGTTVSLSDYNNQKGVILVFTCNPCPFARAYEKRIIRLHTDYAEKGFPVVAINPNDPGLSPEDSFEKMKERAEEMSYPFPYLKDEKQEVCSAYGATRTPHIFLLENTGGEFRVAYVGAIDDNAMNTAPSTNHYLDKAIAALMAGKRPKPETTMAVGCTIKAKS